MGSVYGVNYRHGFIRGMDNVVGDYKRMLVENDMLVEIAQNEESGEKEPGTPERVRNPGVQVIVRSGRRVVGNYRRAIIIVIVVDNLGVRIRDEIIYWRFCLFSGWFHGDLRWNLPPNHLQLIPVFLGNQFIPVGVIQHPVIIPISINGYITNWSSLRRWRGKSGHNIQTQFGRNIFHCLLSLILSHF
jgi:hypothetical protein